MHYRSSDNIPDDLAIRTRQLCELLTPEIRNSIYDAIKGAYLRGRISGIQQVQGSESKVCGIK